MSDCRFGVSPVNYPDPESQDTTPRLDGCWLVHLITGGNLKIYFSFQGDIGPFSPGLPIEIPLWMAVNLKQRQKARIRPPDWMDVG